MNKEEFEALDTLKQVEYINHLLHANTSLEAISKSLNTSKNTMKKRLAKANYVAVKGKGNKIIRYELEKKYNKIEVTPSNIEVTSSNIEVTPSNTTSNTKVTSSNTTSNIEVTSSNTIRKRNNIMIELQDDILKIKQRLEILEQRNDLDINLDIEVKDDIITRSIKVSEVDINHFSKVCEESFPQYKKQDIISYVVRSFANKYMKK